MRNRDETTQNIANKIKRIEQRFYKAIEYFGEVKKEYLIIPENFLVRSENVDFEYDFNSNLIKKKVYFPDDEFKNSKIDDVDNNSQFVECNYKYENNRIVELQVYIKDKMPNATYNRYLAYFDLTKFFAIPNDDLTELYSPLIDVNEFNQPRVRFEYNANNLKTKEIHFNNEDKIIEERSFNYNEEGNLIDVTTVYEGKIIRKLIYNYGDIGLIEIKDYNKHGLISRTEFKYSEETQLLVERIKYDNEGIKRDHYYYNADGTLRKKEKGITYERNLFYHIYTYQHFDNGDYLIKDEVSCDTSSYEMNIINANGNLLEKWESDLNSNRTKYIYNEYNLIQKKLISKAYHSQEIVDEIYYKYRYDFNGNWIERVSYRNEIPFEVMTREITYF